MAKYDYSMKRKIEKEIDEGVSERISKLSKKEQQLARDILNNLYSKYGKHMIEFEDKLYEDAPLKLSDYFQKNYNGLVDAFVPSDKQEEFYYIVDRLNLFSYSKGYNRRTVRTKNYGAYGKIACSVMSDYSKYFYLQGKVTDDLTGNYDDEIRKEYAFDCQNAYQIVAAIDIDGGKTAQVIKDAVLSENNNVAVTRSMIRGAYMSKNTELHSLMGDLLLAAKLQEGLRQSLCETLDEGTAEAFKTVLKVIEDNNLIRYSSVKRAISTWIGICDESNIDRINQKMLTLMSTALNDDKKRMEYLNSNDSIELSVGLWATGFYEVNDAMDEMRKLIKHGTKNQRLTVSYYNHSLQVSKFKKEIATVALEEYHDELDTMACFLPEYIDNPRSIIGTLLNDDKGIRYSKKDHYEPAKVKVTDYFRDKEELERHYNILLDIYHQIPKKELIFSPCIFPWYAVKLSKSEVVQLLCLIAYISGDDDKMDFATSIVGEISSDVWTARRDEVLNLVLAHPKTKEQRARLIKFIGNTEETTSNRAYAMVESMELTEDDYTEIVEMLRFKRSYIRNDLIKIIMKQNDTALAKSIDALIKDNKEDKRTAALDMIMQLSMDKGRKKAYDAVKELPKTIAKPTSKEKILIDQLTGKSGQAMQIINTKGLGIYDPEEEFDFIDQVYQEEEPDTKKIFNLFFPLKEEGLVQIIMKLDDFIKAHEDYEYENKYGTVVLFGNTYNELKLSEEEKKDRKPLDTYPLAEELREFYKKEIKSYDILLQLFDYWYLDINDQYLKGEEWYKRIFGAVPYSEKLCKREEFERPIRDVIGNYLCEYREKNILFQRSYLIHSRILHCLDGQNQYVDYKDKHWDGKEYDARCTVRQLDIVDTEMGDMRYYTNDEEFEKAFKMICAIEEKCKEKDTGTFGRAYYHETRNDYYSNKKRTSRITILDEKMMLKAYGHGIISQNMLLKGLIENLKLEEAMQSIGMIKRPGGFKQRDKYKVSDFFGEEFWQDSQKMEQEEFLKTNKIAKTTCEIYDKVAPVAMAVELKRGDTATIFSGIAASISYIEGVDYLVDILKALGKDTLDRGTYYSWNYTDPSKKDNLSHLLQCCYPREGETGKTLGEKLTGSGVTDERLVQTAMYAPQWIDLIEDYLGWKGMKSGCYYFMAHMNGSLDDEKAAMIAKYTPLTPEELRDGAFDIDWFKEAYKALGKKHFGLLYDSAKYISDGNMHTRGRKYADAASGEVKLKELKTQIEDKRNKDLLMSYALVPLRKGGKDALSRYEYIEQFRKESKQFGSQRQTSEGRACDMALTNLSKNAGYSDVTRLVLSMETKLMEQFKAYMNWKAIGDVSIRIHIDDFGTSTLEYMKGEKQLKSLPSKLNKNSYVLEIKEIHKKLKNQYSRTRQMMERSMENKTDFSAAEIMELFSNPIAKAIIKDLVFMAGKKLGFVSDDGKMVDYKGTETKLKEEDRLIIAHPLHLYKAGVWHEYQKYLFDHEIKQSFKQVFRELYVKLEEEKDQFASKMFAGNQIQPHKTVGCLKSRKWIADYEDGLQKVYYKENIIARIYAQADWFSPSDVEEPTLEWVEFSDRKTFKPIKIDDIPDVIYSEVMRDVDLAVSVAHAGGVDPETSHSTIEMRRAIVEFNLPLLHITNVTLQDNHAIVEGTLGKYSVHLGSGVVHQMGGAMLNILPVHSQNRGKLFLPFVDDDPKTAEIMSKIVLLSEDNKIKDPIILDQINR